MLLQNTSEFLLHNAQVFIPQCPSFIRKCNNHYKIQQIYFQMQKFITKRDVHYQMH